MNTRKKIYQAILLMLLINTACDKTKTENTGEWIDLFNGKDLTGWTASENTGSFKVEDGILVASGDRSHLFYSGDLENAQFRNFEFSVDVMTTYLANSGIYFHTKYQEEGWPERGFEVQINNTHIGGGDYRELKKTGSLYGIRNTYKTYVKDSVWFNVHFIVQNKHVMIEVDGRKIVDYMEAADPSQQKLHSRPDSLLTPGTFGLQCHDPESKVFYKNMKIKILPDDESKAAGRSYAINDSYRKMVEIQANQFPFIDLHVTTDDQFDATPVVDFFYRTGINAGLVLDPGKTEKENAATAWTAHAEKYSKLPVFLGVITNNKASAIDLSGAAVKPDYIIGEVVIPENSTDAEKFMNAYVNEIVTFLSNGKIDIWSTPTKLPPSLAANYKQLWTKERMLKIIEAAKANGVAIEIANDIQMPGIEFIKLAKEKGCLFTCGGIDRSEEMGRADYFLKAIQECNLGYKDIYVPGTTIREDIPAKEITSVH